ncbi:MAG: glycosyltransferase [Sterolibacterium sp.]
MAVLKHSASKAPLLRQRVDTILNWPGLSDWERANLFALLPDWPSHGHFGMTVALRHLIGRRPDLRDAFDVGTEEGLWQGIAWFFAHGLKEHHLTDVVDAGTLAALDETPPFFAQEEGAPGPMLNWLMFFIWRSGSDLQAAFDLRDPKVHQRFMAWFFCVGVPSLGLAPLITPRWRLWLRRPITPQGHPDVQLPRFGLLVWLLRADLQQTCDVRTLQGFSGLAEWLNTARQNQPRHQIWWIERDGLLSAATNEAGQLNSGPRPFGLNLIGFAFGELGIGEDVRMAVAACEAVGIPFAVVNIHPGNQLRQADQELAAHVTKKDEAPYAFNLFCLTGFDTGRVFLERGLSLFGGRYNIGWWPWELPVWPGKWEVAFDLVDEVWAATEFTREMYAKAAARAVKLKQQSATPVQLMPLPASVARVKPLSAPTRRALGLPVRSFLFLYVFDFNSYLARKNPFAALEAFSRAFPAGDDSVALVLKTMNSNPRNAVWKRFLRACKADSRIVLIDKTLDRGEVLGLIHACDAYLSLHRSEGFGRTLAEAMLFGKPVVGTNFSGNVDFLTAKTGFPVKWKRKAVLPDEYPFITEADAAWWAEPDIADAARQMRATQEAARDKSFAARVKQFAERQFAPERIGQLMFKRLSTIVGVG